MALIFKIEDFFRKTKINAYYKEYHSYMNLDVNQIQQIQNEKLNKLVRHVWNNIPWYQKSLSQMGYCPKYKFSKSDLKLLPVLSRSDIQEFLEQMTWRTYLGKIYKSSSSGTTGIPINYGKDVNALSSGIATANILMSISKWKPGMSSAHIWGNMESVKQWNKVSSKIKQSIYSRKNIISSLLNDDKQIEKVIIDMIKFKPTVIDGYANSIFELACYLKKKNIRIPSVKIVFTTAENLEKQHANMIENIIAPVSDLYGCGEINGIACKPTNENKYYIFDPHVIVETLDNEDSNLNEIVVTDLDNYYMPLIRYKVGDLIDKIHLPSDSNSLSFNFFTKVFGRTSDYILLDDGRKIFPVNIFGGTLYRKYSSIRRHKTIWDGTKLVFLFENRNELDLIALETDIKLSLKEYNVPYEINTTEKLLPSANGKYKYFEKIK